MLDPVGDDVLGSNLLSPKDMSSVMFMLLDRSQRSGAWRFLSHLPPLEGKGCWMTEPSSGGLGAVRHWQPAGVEGVMC